MKILKIFALLTVIPAFAFSQVKTDTIKEISLPPIKYNYKNCVFTIKTKGWNGSEVLQVSTMITNNSDDTLKYKMESCWFLYYKVSTDSLKLENAKDDCLGNIPGTEIIPPHQSKTRDINIIKIRGIHTFYGKMRVAFYLKLRRGNELMGDYVVQNGMICVPKDLDKGSHWIWSNFVNL
jgi:hypothetical protein